MGGWIDTPVMVPMPLLTWLGMEHSDAWLGSRTLALTVTLMLALVAGWSAVCHYGQFARSAWAPGLAQRLFVSILYGWVEIVGIRLCA